MTTVLWETGIRKWELKRWTYMAIWVSPYDLGIKNDRDTRFIEFYKENNLVMINTWFKIPGRRLYTWKSPQDRAGPSQETKLTTVQSLKDSEMALSARKPILDATLTPIIIQLHLQLE